MTVTEAMEDLIRPGVLTNRKTASSRPLRQNWMLDEKWLSAKRDNLQIGQETINFENRKFHYFGLPEARTPGSAVLRCKLKGVSGQLPK